VLRYVLAVVLTVAILTISLPAAEYGIAVRGETQTERAIATVDAAAVSLFATERLPVAGEPPPRRTVDLSLPGEGPLVASPDRLVFERVPGENLTRVRYRVGDRAEQTVLIDAPLSSGGQHTLSLAGHSGDLTLVLRLVADGAGRPLVAVSIGSEPPAGRDVGPDAIRGTPAQ